MSTDAKICIRRALISVSDKTGLETLSQTLAAKQIDILSTGGTQTFLENHQVKTTAVSNYTGYPEIMGGRVKTLHPKIYGGILGRRDTDQQVMQDHAIDAIDLVVVNLYPFRETVARADCELPVAIENIDIGGPAMIRAAAKNYRYVAVVVDPADYQQVITEIDTTGGISEKTRFSLAIKAFAHTAEYDTAIQNYLHKQTTDCINSSAPVTAEESNNTSEQLFPEQLGLSFCKQADLRYGENPHQKSAFYTQQSPSSAATLATAKQQQGKALSYNNLVDSDAAFSCVTSFNTTACVIVKHANPCGVALGSTSLQAYQRAFAADPVSAFGGIIAFNCSLDKETAATIIAQQFAEVIIAPEITPEAADVFTAKKNLRTLAFGELASVCRPEYNYKWISGGLLLQTTSEIAPHLQETEIVTERKPTETEMTDLMFAAQVVQFVKSNAIVLVKDGQTIGIGAGQMSRVYSAKIAAMKAEEQAFTISGAVMASDAFFPFRDSIDVAAEQGISAVIQPGGSLRDGEVINAANEYAMAMVFTGRRCFLH